jgi:hypothetical protein
MRGQTPELDRELPKNGRYTETPLPSIGSLMLSGGNKSILKIDAGSDFEADWGYR